MSLQVIALLAGAIGFGVFGITLLIRPHAMAAVDLPADTPNARTEIRAMYGGLEIGIAAFLALAIAWPELAQTALIFQLFALGGLAIGRLLAIAVDGGRVKRVMWTFVVLEAGAAVLTAVALV